MIPGMFLVLVRSATVVMMMMVVPPPPSNRSLHYRMLEETMPGTFVADLQKDMKLRGHLSSSSSSSSASADKKFDLRADLESANDIVGKIQKFHLNSAYFSEQAGNSMSERFDLFEYTLINLPHLSTGNSNATLFFEVTRGILRSKVKLDREVICSYRVTCHVICDVLASSVERNALDQARIEIEVVDINDHEPVFQPDRIELKISESAEVGAGFNLPLAIDRDSPRFSVETYLLVSEDFTPFELLVGRRTAGPTQVPAAGPPDLIKLLLREKLDREQVTDYNLKVIAYDAGDEFVGIPSKTGSLNLHVQITDVNDNFPLFQTNSSEVKIMTNQAPFEPFYKVMATDRDQGINGELIFGFDNETETKFGNLFSINNISGEIFLKSRLDEEPSPSPSTFTLVVTAADMAGTNHPSSLTSTTLVTVGVLVDTRPLIRIFADERITCNGLEARLVSKYEAGVEPSEREKIKLFVQLSPRHESIGSSTCTSEEDTHHHHHHHPHHHNDHHHHHHSKRNWIPLFRIATNDAGEEESEAIKVELIFVSRGGNKFDPRSEEDLCMYGNFFLDPQSGKVYATKEILTAMIKERITDDDNDDKDDNKSKTSLVNKKVTNEVEPGRRRKHLTCQMIARVYDRRRPAFNSEVSIFVLIGRRSDLRLDKKKKKNLRAEQNTGSKSPSGRESGTRTGHEVGADRGSFVDDRFEKSHEQAASAGPREDSNWFNRDANEARHGDGFSPAEMEETPNVEHRPYDHWLDRHLGSADLVLVLSVVLFLVVAAVVLAVVVVFDPQKLLFISARGGDDNNKE